MSDIVYNHDIAGVVNRLDMFIYELYKSVSSSTSQMNEFDQSRLATYLDAIDAYHDHIVAQPHLDLPESTPRPWPLKDAVDYALVENQSVNDLIRLLQLARIELINSQSARDAANLNKFDSARLRAITEKARRFLTDYIAVVTPLDVPESTPQEPISGPGRTGV